MHTKYQQDGLFYAANVSVGTPPQPMRMIIDTGSADFWVNTPTSDLCAKVSACEDFGVYTANSSSTYRYIDGNFNISYQDGGSATGDYVSDTLTVGGLQVPNLQMGVAYHSETNQNVWGVGYPIIEGGDSYPNAPFQMVIDGLISSAAFSLWLNDQENATGSILFGGVDTARYSGSLQTLPIIPYGTSSDHGPAKYIELQINLTSVSAMINGKTTKLGTSLQPEVALLDSGATACYFPDTIAQSIYTAVGATYNVTSSEAACPCSVATLNATLNFDFANKTITVPISEFVRQPSDPNPVPGGEACLLAVLPSSGGSSYVLGDPFLRSAYVVYDLSNNEIAIAQTAFNVTTSRVLEIVNGTGGIPAAVGSGVSRSNLAAAAAPGAGSRKTVSPRGLIRQTDSVVPTKNGGARVVVGSVVVGVGVVAIMVLVL